MDNFPVAFVLASCDEVYKNNNVLYRLVKPAQDACGVESTDRLVNVVPFRRKYQFKAIHEIEGFIHEILYRPLVLQPILHYGRGIGNCGACYTDEQWVIMVNQTHPKILSRLQMAFDVAKAAYIKGQSAELKFNFGKAIQRLYQDHLKKKEKEEANGSALRTFLSACRYSEWEHGDLIVRFHGYSADGLQRNQNVDMEWDFEDIVAEEVMWSQICDETFPKPHLASVSEDEIRHVLPTWTINGVSPLLDVGEEVPNANYSYSKAGKLYESFKRKKKHRETYPEHREHLSHGAVGGATEEDLGAVGGSDSFHAIEHDFTNGNEKNRQNASRSSSRRAYMNVGSPYSNEDRGYGGNDRLAPQEDVYLNGQHAFSTSSHDIHTHKNEQRTRNMHYHASNPSSRRSEVNGHFDTDVVIVTPSASPYDESYGNKVSLHLYETSLNLKKQDSERSTGSTNADSGYCEEGQRSRGDSYDYNDNVGSSKFKYERYNNERLNDLDAEKGLDNPAFSHYDEMDDAVAKHKKMVAASMSDRGATTVVGHEKMNNSKQIAESFI